MICTVPADGLAPLGARPSAGMVMIKYDYHKHMQLGLEGFSTKKLCVCVFASLSDWLWFSGPVMYDAYGNDRVDYWYNMPTVVIWLFINASK